MQNYQMNKYVVEFGSYGDSTEYTWHKTWNDFGINHTVLIPMSVHNSTRNILPHSIPVYLISKHMNKHDFCITMQKNFAIPQYILRTGLCKKISILSRFIINSLIIKKHLKALNKQQPINAVLLHNSFGVEVPLFHNTHRTFFYLHSTISKSFCWATDTQRRRSKKAFANKRIIGCGYASKKDFATLNIPTHSLDFVLNGIATQKVQSLSKAPLPKAYQKQKYITTVCRLSPEKQIPKIIEAYVKSGIDAKFIIIGDGSEQSIIQQKITELKCDDSVILYGRDNNPFKWFKHAVFSVMFSSFEGAPRTIPESLAVGTPVIVGNKGGCYEYLQNTPLQDYIIDTTDIEALACAMKKMYKDPVTIPTEMQNKHSYENHIAGLIDIFTKKGIF